MPFLLWLPQPPWCWGEFSGGMGSPCCDLGLISLWSSCWAKQGADPAFSLLFCNTAAYFCLIPFQTDMPKSEKFGVMPAHARSCPELYLQANGLLWGFKMLNTFLAESQWIKVSKKMAQPTEEGGSWPGFLLTVLQQCCGKGHAALLKEGRRKSVLNI